MCTAYGCKLHKSLSLVSLAWATCATLFNPLNQDFHFDPGTETVYIRAAPNTTSFRAEPCTSPPAAGPKARPSAHRR